jgi:hypothetical protein
MIHVRTAPGRDGRRRRTLQLAIVLVLWALLAAGCAAEIVDAPISKCKLYILAGQSNMVGRGRYDQLPPEERLLPDNVAIRARSLDHHLAEVEGVFGPEHSLARVLGRAYPDHSLFLVKYAVDASSLLDWQPVWTEEDATLTGHAQYGPLYQSLMGWLEKTRGTIPEDCEAAAFFWMQGERDALFPEAARQYEENLVRLIAHIRADLGVPDLPFFLGQVNPPTEQYPAVEEVRAAQARLAERVRHTALVPTDGLSKAADGLHYDTAGQVELGRRFAQAYQAMCQSR